MLLKVQSPPSQPATYFGKFPHMDPTPFKTRKNSIPSYKEIVRNRYFFDSSYERAVVAL